MNKLAGTKWAMAPGANLNALMELLAKTAREQDSRDTLADKLIGAARFMGLSDDAIEDALYETFDGPVFYYP